MTEDQTQVHLVVSKSQKGRWEQYVEESQGEFNSLSQLIRRGVEREINDDGAAQASGISDDVSGKLSEVIEGLDRVESRVHDLDNRLGAIESEVSEDEGLRELASDVFEALPTRDELVDYEKKLRNPKTRIDPKEPVSHTGRIEDIAHHLDEKEHRVEQALEKLLSDMNQVGTIVLNEEIEGWAQEYENGDETRYYKDG